MACGVALASSLYDTERSPLGLSQTKTITSRQIDLPKSYRDLLSPRTSGTPSLVDINNLESSITQTQNQLDSLKSQNPKDPTLRAKVDAAIQEAQAKLTSLNAKLQSTKAGYATYIAAKEQLRLAIEKYDAAVSAENNLVLLVSQNTSTHEADLLALNNQIIATQEAKTELASAKEALTNAQSAYNSAQLEANSAYSELFTKQSEVAAARVIYDQAVFDYNKTLEAYDVAYNAYLSAQGNLTEAQNTLNQAQEALNQAQWNYDNLLIPDPTWTAPTYQKENIRVIPETIIVEEVTTTTQQSENILPPLDHTTWSGAGTGAQGSQPTINQGVVKFSYMMQGVTSTGQVNSPANEPFTLSVDVKNMDANRGIQDTYKIELFTYNAQGQQNGYAVFNSPQGWHDWTTRTISTTPTSDVASYKVVLSAIDGGFWWGTYGPEMKNPTLSATTTTTTITYREETIYRYETYYTTEPVLVEGTIQVKINEGGQATFTAPEGATFTGSNLRYEAINRPQCGIDINPPVQGKTQITISASNGVWGDPCGGWYKHVTGTISYLGQPTAPLINDPALLPALQEAQINYQEAQTAYATASTNWSIAQLNQQEAAQNSTAGYYKVIDTATTLNTLSAELDQKQQTYTSADQVLSTKEQDLAQANQTATDKELVVSEAETSLEHFQEKEASSNFALTNTKLELEDAKTNSASSQQDKATAEQNVAASEQQSQSLYQELAGEVPPQLSIIEEILNTEPEPEPEPEGSAEIPEVIEDLMEVDLKAVDPTELTPEQAQQLVEAALVVFETATEGSAEYEQALDALYLAAEQDDIVIDPALADIPGVGQAAAAVIAVFNIVGNVGADIAPEKRKKAQTLVVTTLVVGQIAQTAAMATAAASSSSYRRK